MRCTWHSGLGIFLWMAVVVAVMAAATGIAAMINSPPPAIKPDGLSALEAREDRDLRQLLNDINPRYTMEEIETVPPVDPRAPTPAGTYLYNNLLDNLLSGLHYYFTVPEDTQPSTFVVSWDASTGERVLSDARLLSLENNLSYLLALVIYRGLHSKAVFDEDFELARKRVSDIFAEDWHTVAEWPLGPYFDLINLWEITGEDQFLEWAERYGAGDGPADPQTPLAKARSIYIRFQNNLPRTGSPFQFYHAAMLADWGSRHDPVMLSQARSLFEGLRNLLYDERYHLLYKQVAVQPGGTTNLTQTFDTLEQLSAVRAIIEYGKASGDPGAVSLARAVLDGTWGQGSPLLMPAPEPFPETTFYGLYTAYDLGREAERLDPGERTIIQILLYESCVLLNEQTRGELRGDVDFLAGWLEDSGPMYRRVANGYFTTYEDDWAEPLQLMVSARASIWMARALAWDELYRFRTAQVLTSGRIGE